MTGWPENPLIYEVNTWVWLEELGRREGSRVTLASVPDASWDAIGALGADAVWLMGVWERSPEGRAIADQDEALIADFRSVLTDYTEADNVGSPYCVRRYEVDAHLGGREGLARARSALAARGIRLVLDYVPNHVALDHPLVAEHPDYFINGSLEDFDSAPLEWFTSGNQVIARGRDPNFPPWTDVAQLNAFSPDFRSWAVETVASIADQCDGMRCDMAMLMMNDVFSRTWGERAGCAPPTEFWPELISAVKRRHPGVIFIAEAYWDLEFGLQQQGFDYCYDKRLYDRLVHDSADSVRNHLGASIDYQRRLVRFIENHDEPRAAAAFAPPERGRAAAVVALTLPGARLLHQGQEEGRSVRIPVFLGRGPDDPSDEDLAKFYRQLLGVVREESFKEGTWSLCEVSGWPDNDSHRRLVAWTWQDEQSRCLVVVNLSDAPAQARIELPWADAKHPCWQVRDHMTGELFERDGHELALEGLFVDLPAWQFHLLSFGP